MGKKKPVTSKPDKPKVLKYLSVQERQHTRAFWATSHVRASASVYFMAYADHAKKALDQSHTVPRTLFEAQDFNLIEEAKRNKELHASMDFMRILLKKHHKSKTADDVVEPLVSITPPHGGYKRSLFQYADDMAKSYKPLGDWMSHILTQHQQKLAYLKFPFSYIPAAQPPPVSSQMNLPLNPS